MDLKFWLWCFLDEPHNMSKLLKCEDPYDPTYAQLGHLLYAMPLNVKPVLQ